MRRYLIPILLILLVQQVLAIGLQFPIKHDRSIVFEPGKLIKLDYSVGNSDPSDLNVNVQIMTDLPITVIYPQELTIPAHSNAPLPIEFIMPSILAEGLYPLSMKVSEKPRGGMAMITAVQDDLSIISQYPNGHPYGRLFSSSTKQGEPLPFTLEVQNIGKTPLTMLKGTAKLGENQRAETNIILLAPLAKGMLKGQIDTKSLPPGAYKLQVNLEATEASELVENTVHIGTPKITVTGKPSINSGEDNTFTLQVLVEEWTTPIDAFIRVYIGTLFEGEMKLTLTPGMNELEFTGHADSAKGGEYNGNIAIYAQGIVENAAFKTDVKGTLVQGGFGFKANQEEPSETDETPETPELHSPAPVKSKTFLIVLLIASFVVFAFALGRYLGSNKENNGPQITPP